MKQTFAFLAEPVDAASLVIFRAALGILGAVLALRYLIYGWAVELYVRPDVLLPYPGFEWIPRLPASLVEAHFAVVGLAALFVGLGILGDRVQRVSLAVFVASLAWIELLDQTNYVNHHYFLVIAALLLLVSGVVPRWGRADAPGTAPRWLVLAVRAQVGMVYFYAGVAKLNSDWLAGQPLALWLDQRSEVWPLAILAGFAWLPLAMSWAGMLFDLLATAGLLVPATRRVTFALLVVFHLVTWRLFPSLGVFPWLMIAGATTFFAPGWPRRFAPKPWPTGAPPHAAMPSLSSPAIGSVIGAVSVSLLLVVQGLLPIRHTLLSDDVNWTEAGYRFSWRVMLNEKAGSLRYLVCPTAETRGTCRLVVPEDWFTPLQVERMAYQPTMIVAGAQHIALRLGLEDQSMQAESWVAMNGRPASRLMDPERNLLTLSADHAHRAVLPREE